MNLVSPELSSSWFIKSLWRVSKQLSESLKESLLERLKESLDVREESIHLEEEESEPCPVGVCFIIVTVLSPFTLHSLSLCIEVGHENFYESQHENVRIISKEYVLQII